MLGRPLLVDFGRADVQRVHQVQQLQTNSHKINSFVRWKTYLNGDLLIAAGDILGVALVSVVGVGSTLFAPVGLEPPLVARFLLQFLITPGHVGLSGKLFVT